MFPWRRLALRRRVLVNLMNGSAIQGILWQKAGPLLVIRDAVILEPKADPVSADGEVLVERRMVAFIQAL